MTRPVALQAVVEDMAGEAALIRLASDTGLPAPRIHVKNGKTQIDRRLRSYNQAARWAVWIVLRDLDTDAECAPDLIKRLIPDRHRNLIVRVAVRAVEAWFPADSSGLGRFLRIPAHVVPQEPEKLMDPKAVLVDLARRSRRKGVKDDMIPPGGYSSRVGIGYNARIIEFAFEFWNPIEASASSRSLAGCLKAFESLR